MVTKCKKAIGWPAWDMHFIECPTSSCYITLGYPRSGIVLGSKGQRSRLGLWPWLRLGYRNTAWVRTLWVPSSLYYWLLHGVVLVLVGRASSWRWVSFLSGWGTKESSTCFRRSRCCLRSVPPWFKQRYAGITQSLAIMFNIIISGTDVWEQT